MDPEFKPCLSVVALLKIKSTTNFATTGALNTEAMGYTETEMREDNPETPPKKVKSG